MAMVLVTAVGLFVGTFGAYAVGLFDISGGVIFIPGEAAVVGAVVAGIAGYLRGGLLAGWLVTYASVLGYRADHAFMGLSSRSVPEQLAYFLQLEGLGVIAIQALVIGTIAYAIGSLVRISVRSVTGHLTSAS